MRFVYAFCFVNRITHPEKPRYDVENLKKLNGHQLFKLLHELALDVGPPPSTTLEDITGYLNKATGSFKNYTSCFVVLTMDK
jgi:hypothetical protein